MSILGKKWGNAKKHTVYVLSVQVKVKVQHTCMSFNKCNSGMSALLTYLSICPHILYVYAWDILCICMGYVHTSPHARPRVSAIYQVQRLCLC